MPPLLRPTQRERHQPQAPLPLLKRRAGVWTGEEVDGIEEGSTRGRVFRIFFLLLITVLVVFLAFAKWNAEFHIPLSDRVKHLTYTAQGVGSTTAGHPRQPPSPPSSDSQQVESTPQDQAMLDSYLDQMGLRDPSSTPAPRTTAASDDDTFSFETAEDRIKRRRREDYEFKKTLKAAHEAKINEQAALTTCGKACQTQYLALQVQYDRLNQRVVNELISVVASSEEEAEKIRQSQNSGNGAATSFFDPIRMKAKTDAKIQKLRDEAEVDGGGAADLDLQLAVEEIQEGYAILSNEESRRYYLMTGDKPPILMSKKSARDSDSWGESVLHGEHHRKMIFGWLKYLDNSKVDTFTLAFVFLCIFLGPALAKLPQTIAMAQRMADEWEQAAAPKKKH